MVKATGLALLGLVTVGGYLLLKSNNVFAAPAAQTVPGYRVDGKADTTDVGTTKVLPNVSTTKTPITKDVSMKKSAKDEVVIRYNTAPTATAKIKAAVKVLPKNQSQELASNLAKLGW